MSDLWRTKDLQVWVNNRFNDPTKIIIDKNMFDKIITKDGLTFLVSDEVRSVAGSRNNYVIDDIRKDDIVIDIGANIGGFSLPASLKSDKVFAVEPIMVEELKENIKLNKANVEVIESGLGNGNFQEIEWAGIKKNIKTMTLSEIIDHCGGCDFLKMNCEGAEWFIKEEEIKNIRRIEMTYHQFKPHQLDNLIKMLSKYFVVRTEKRSSPEFSEHGRLHAKLK